MEEPSPPPGFIASAWEYGAASTIPRLMLDSRPSGGVSTARRSHAPLPGSAPPFSIPCDHPDTSKPAPSTRPRYRNVTLAACTAPLSLRTLRCSFAGERSARDAQHRQRRQAGDAAHDGPFTGGLVPEIGYWAEEADPNGDAPPALLHVPRRRAVGERHHVARCSTPRIRCTGSAGAAPSCCCRCSGAVFSALAARALARRLGGGNGWTAYWAIGLAQPRRDLRPRLLGALARAWRSCCGASSWSWT